jgi:serine/threonine-protein kinase
MGDVYRAHDHRLGRDIAIKVVSEATASDPVSLSRFTQEAHAVAALNHPHIVTIYSTEEADGVRFMTMELIEGRTLARMIPEDGLSVAQFFDVSIAVADALSAAHHKHITHRDLTPANVMVTSEGQVKVLDFGLARGGEGEGPAQGNIADLVTVQRLTGAGTILGTMPYMSPEQIEAKPLDQRTDIFSLGIVMYEMATGGRPFRGDTKPALMSSIMRDRPRPVLEVRPDLPAAVARLIDRCLEKDPRDRVQTAHEILLELRSLRRVWESGVTAPAAKRTATSPWPWVAAAAVALGLGLVGLRSRGTPSGPARAAVNPPLIVVLPFANVTKDPSDQVLADGLFETVTSSLTRIERFPGTLRVVPASEVRREQVASAADARRKFGAILAISGSLQSLSPAAHNLTLNLIDAGASQVLQVASRTLELASASVNEEVLGEAITALLAPQFELGPEARKAMTEGGTSNPRAYGLLLRGRGYLQRFDLPGNIDRAIRSLNQAVAADPRYALAHGVLGEAYWRRYRLTGEKASLDRAAEQAEKALAIANRLAPVQVTLAMIARERGRFEQAVAYAQTAVELDPVGSDGYRELGSAYDQLQQDAEAEATYRQAVAARANDWLAHNRLGVFLLNHRRWSEAEAEFRLEMKLVPDNTAPHNNLGAMYSAMGRPVDAAAAWEQSMKIRPTYSTASNLGSTHYSSGRYANAAQAYERALALSAGDYKTWSNLGAALHWVPDAAARERAAYLKAVELAEAARRLNPRQPEVLAILADSYSILGQRTKALGAAAAVERLGSTEPKTLFTVANAYEQLGDRDRALRWLGKALAAGFDRDGIERSPWLESLRKDKRFAPMMKQAKTPTGE